MKIGFIYSGQGAQYHGMGKELYETSKTFSKTIDEASEALGWDMKELLFNEASSLNETEFTQPAVLALSTAIDRLLREEGIIPEMVAGLSLGEYSALVASGALKFDEALRLVQKRGRWMTEAVPSGEGAMAAVMNVDRQIIEQTCEEVSRSHGVVIAANYNMPGQIVISGETAAVEEAQQRLSEQPKSKVVRLNVSGPFHTPLLAPAADKLETALSHLAIHEMSIPVVSNVDGHVISSAEEIAPTLVKQIKSPVYWEECVQTMIEKGIDTFVEVGPGKALRSFVKKIDRKVAVFNVENSQTFEKLISKIKEYEETQNDK
ncbi:ACP S-malonyltransferase [Vagococcus xieshaowenii]|uniref:Malonyl CoA-acyl carrier protein transacylase n=1 Tax=Vagococcus xieshaowenii TaxID=2562451 RepID=A0AAJ5JLA2_9ENTE|nr:ACP S-malonyltransferase [Vagococcus xieshaowenii]QCA28331.1 ACP S-malonyltransferase [Vagococcus xieshaowenii]TFZ42281.1 ACP S-malonyltransferase [Vagococcus xieshaowenii]